MTGQSFYFVRTSWNEARTTLSCDYKIVTDEDEFQLTETLEFPAKIPENSASKRIVKALHLALGISYYKAFVPPAVVHPYKMDVAEAAFWNTVYKKGLAEFLYKNNLSASLLAEFKEQDGVDLGEVDISELKNTALLGLGGGKDSIVAGELLKELEIKPTGYVLATGEILGQTKQVADIMNVELLPVKRGLDLKIIEINKLDGTFNGHIPISLVFALAGCMLAVTQQSKYVIVANEASSSIPQVNWEGLDVNHQWSKSLEFERLFQEYVSTQINPNLNYFSAIRPLTSLGVAQLFTNYPEYFESFTSDNSVFRIKQGERDHPRWSVDSPKSLSSYILLAPFMSGADLDRTFGRNFLDDANLEELFISLLGRSNTPILDCVGTPNELLYSLQELHKQNRFTSSALMEKAINEGLVGNDKSTVEGVELEDKHAFPGEIQTKLLAKIKEKLHDI